VKILVFIPMWKRRRVMDWALKSLEAALERAPWLDAQRFAVVSREEDFVFATERGFDCFYAENDAARLGAKFNAGMAHALQTRGFDFVFQMNSDTILAQDFFAHARPHLEAGKLMTGINIIGFFDTGLSAEEADEMPAAAGEKKQGAPISNKGNRFRCADSILRYNYTAGCGIRFIAREAIEQAGWQRLAVPKRDMAAARISFRAGDRGWVPRYFYAPKNFADGGEEHFRLWPEKPNGLDNSSHRAIAACYPALAAHPFFGAGQMLALDVKSGQNLWGIENFADGHRLLFRSVEGRAALARFPALADALSSLGAPPEIFP
jgi:hypothetical protein